MTKSVGLKRVVLFETGTSEFPIMLQTWSQSAGHNGTGQMVLLDERKQQPQDGDDNIISSFQLP